MTGALEDANAIEVGCFEDQQSLASINIIQIANSGLSPSSNPKTKRKYAAAANNESSGFRPPLDLTESLASNGINGHRLLVKSLLASSQDMPAPQMESG